MKHRFATLKIADIRIGDRIRSFPGDLSALKESMQSVGLLNPILVDSSDRLIAGYRRLTAARQLGWETIDVRIVDVADTDLRLLMEIGENTARQDFSPEQLARGEKRLRRCRNRGAGWKLLNWILG